MQTLSQQLLTQHKDWHDQIRTIKGKLEDIIKEKNSKMSSAVGVLNYQLRNADGNPTVKIESEVLQNIIKVLSEAAYDLPLMEVDYHKVSLKKHTDDNS